MLDRFEIAHFTLHLRAVEPMILPAYKGSTFRGAFGMALKELVCIRQDRDCGPCIVKNTCAYYYVFETPVLPGSAMMKKYPYAPHPFILRPPLVNQTELKAGEGITCGLVLVGRAIAYLPYFILTFERLGSRGVGKGRGRFSVERVTNGDSGKVVYSGVGKTLDARYSTLKGMTLSQPGDDSVRRMTLTFLTPTRLRYQGELTEDLEFHVLIRNLLRRISMLLYFHCGQDPSGLNIHDLIEKALVVRTVKNELTWQDWERYSRRQEARMKLGGVVGSIAYEGNLGPFLPYLRLGEYVHVGKGTSFGLGWYRIHEGEEFKDG